VAVLVGTFEDPSAAEELLAAMRNHAPFPYTVRLTQCLYRLEHLFGQLCSSQLVEQVGRPRPPRWFGVAQAESSQKE